MKKTNYPKLKMTQRQKSVYARLEELSTPIRNPNGYNLKKWYLGALYTLDNENNPDRFSQAANSLRELMEKLVMITLNIYEPRKVRKPETIEKFYTKIDAVLRPSQEKREMITEFRKLFKYLEYITHHRPEKRPTSKEFREHLEQLEEILLNFKNYVTEREDKEIKKILGKIEKKKTKEQVEILLKLPKTNSPYVLDMISNAILKIRPLEESIKLKNWVLVYLKVCIDPDVISNLIKYWSKKKINGVNEGMELIKEMISFKPGPKYNEKIGTWNHIQPKPELKISQYCKILREGVCTASENRPFEIASILIKATSDMLVMEVTPEDREQGNDYSEIWCKDLEDVTDERKLMIPTEAMRKLMQTLTFACERVYEKETVSIIEELDALLTKEKWAFFKRLRYHLYSLNSNEQTKSKIRKLILDYEYHNEKKYGYEFQKMVRVACEHFGEQLLTKDERQNIFDIIFKGPSKNKNFQAKRFRPFSAVLFGQYKNYYKGLTETKDITDEDYREKLGNIYNVIPQSPIPKETLSQFTDQELLDCINNNQERESKIEDGNRIQIGFEGLVKEFEVLFAESIINTSRIDFWLQNLKNIKYSVYIRSIFTEISEDIREGNFEPFDIYLKFYKNILPAANEEFCIEYYYDVVNFIEACLLKGELLAIKKNRESLLELLCKLCTEYGFRISKDVIPTLTKEGKITVNCHDAHGHARRHALSALIELGYWIRQYDVKADLNAITGVLEKRFDDKQYSYPLTLPERITLAEEYRNIHILEPEWALQNKSKFFPYDNPENLKLFEKTFAQFLDANQADIETFKIIHKELLVSIRNLAEFKIVEDPLESLFVDQDGRNLVEVLEEHLAYYYILGAYPLEGGKNLLQEYYRQISMMKKRGGEIFRTIGYLAGNCEKGSEQKFKDYFNWRFPEEKKERDKRIQQKELEQFVPNWLEAECLDIEWRLNRYSRILGYSKILDIGPPRYTDLQSKILTEMLPEHLEKVMECFAKLVRVLKSYPDEGIEYCIYQKRIELILVPGLESNNKNVRQNAEQACKDLIEMEDHNWVSDLIEKYNVN